MMYNVTLNSHKFVYGSCNCSFCTVCTVLFSVFLTTRIGTGTAFILIGT